MSICRSEALFSSMRDSANAKDATSKEAPGGAGGASSSSAAQDVGGANPGATGPIESSLISDSLIDGACSIDLTEQVKVNKNHYQLTYSRHGAAAVMGASVGGGGGDEPEGDGRGVAAAQPPVIGEHQA